MKLIKGKSSDKFMLNMEGVGYITTYESTLPYKLSLKNCQAIEHGYDLDELAKEYVKISSLEFNAFEAGFQKRDEMLSDKKFSISDMESACAFGMALERLKSDPHKLSDDEEWKGFIQSLQLTEWDVEIEMICPHPEDTYVCGIQYGCDEDGCNHPKQVPLLDSEGCIILKRMNNGR